MAARSNMLLRTFNVREIARAGLVLAAGFVLVAATVALVAGLAGTRKSGAGLAVASAPVSAATGGRP